MTAPSGDPAEHTAPAMPSSTVATCTTVSMGETVLHLGHPSGEPLPQVSRTLARHMRCMNCQTRIIPSPPGCLPTTVEVTAPHTARHRARGLGGRGAKAASPLGETEVWPERAPFQPLDLTHMMDKKVGRALKSAPSVEFIKTWAALKPWGPPGPVGVALFRPGRLHFHHLPLGGAQQCPLDSEVPT